MDGKSYLSLEAALLCSVLLTLVLVASGHVTQPAGQAVAASPSNLSGTVVNGTTVVLTWQPAVVTGVVGGAPPGYTIQHAVVNGPAGADVVIVAAAVPQQRLQDLRADTVYEFRIAAVLSGVLGSFSKPLYLRTNSRDHPCSRNPCPPNTRCLLNTSAAQCVCAAPWSGPACDDVDPCAVNPCRNGGSCSAAANGSYACLCAGPHQGRNCSESKANSCQNMDYAKSWTALYAVSGALALCVIAIVVAAVQHVRSRHSLGRRLPYTWGNTGHNPMSRATASASWALVTVAPSKNPSTSSEATPTTAGPKPAPTRASMRRSESKEGIIDREMRENDAQRNTKEADAGTGDGVGERGDGDLGADRPSSMCYEKASVDVLGVDVKAEAKAVQSRL